MTVTLNSSTDKRKARAIVHKLRQEMPNAPDWELAQAFEKLVRQDESLRGLAYPHGQVTEDWLCIDCGTNTAPGVPDGATTIQQFNMGAKKITMHVDANTEIYMVRDAIWKKAGMEPFSGCLCIGCLEKRLGRRLKPKDFLRDHPFNQLPTGTPRLLNRRDRDYKGSYFILERGPYEFEAMVSVDKSLGVFDTSEKADEALARHRRKRS